MDRGVSMKRTIGEIAEIVMGQSPKSEFYNNNGEGMPFLQGNRTFGDLYPTFDTYTTNPTKMAKAGDIIMSVRAPVGDLNITPVDMCLGRGVCALRMKNGNQSYLFYLLKHNVKTLINRESGTVFGSVNYKDIASLIVDYEENEEEQQRIGQFLWDIDQKIETNKAINNNLEQQAFALFDSLFPRTIDGSQTIGDYINPKRGRNLLSKDAVYGTVPVVAGGLEPSTYHNVANTKAPVLTISASGANAGFVNLWLNPVWSSDSSYIDSSMTPNVFFWYILLKGRQKEIFDAQTGSAQPHIYPQHIAAMPIDDLNQELVSQFTTQVAPLFELIGANKDENERLSNIRDALLPRLMSGEIDVSDICI